MFQPSISPKYSLDAPVDNPNICDFNVDLGYEDNEFNVPGGNVDDHASFGYFKAYDPSIDPYYVCLEDLARKIIWSTFFNPFYDFSIKFDKVKRTLVAFGVIFLITSYLLFSELWSQEFDKLLHALAMSDLI